MSFLDDIPPEEEEEPKRGRGRPKGRKTMTPKERETAHPTPNSIPPKVANKKNPWTPSPREDLFCRKYLELLNITQAYIAAGYSQNQSNQTIRTNAHNMFRKPKIQRRITRLRENLEANVGIGAEYVIHNLVTMAQECREKVPVLDKEGNDIGQWRHRNENAAIKAFELIGKHLGIWIEKVEVKGKIEHDHRHGLIARILASEEGENLLAAVRNKVAYEVENTKSLPKPASEHSEQVIEAEHEQKEENSSQVILDEVNSIQKEEEQCLGD